MRRKNDRQESPGEGDSSIPPSSMNPYDGKPGFFNGLNRIVFRFAGPAQVGIGRPEEPYSPPENPSCPLCHQEMSLHVIDRTGVRTQLYCPAPDSAPATA